MMSPYTILGLPLGANAQEARKAFRAIAKSCHPDVNPDPKAREMFEAAKEAYREITGAAAKADQQLLKSKRLQRMAEIDLPISILTAAQGGTVKGHCPLGKASVKIPQGARSGDRILTKIGKRDVACVIRIEEDDGFRVEGSDILALIKITAHQAKLGDFVEINTPTGRYRVKIPADTPNGAVLRIEGKGLPATKHRPAGHIYLDVEVFESATDKAVAALDRILDRASRPRRKPEKKAPVFGKQRFG